jgi:hypothetical protein
MSLSFLILAVRFLAVFMGLALLGLAVSGAWALTCWIAGRVQRRSSDRRAAAALDAAAQAAAALDQLDLHAREEGRS